jgi:alpha-ketoglutarate-dependent taurine dioxygenase
MHSLAIPFEQYPMRQLLAVSKANVFERGWSLISHFPDCSDDRTLLEFAVGMGVVRSHFAGSTDRSARQQIVYKIQVKTDEQNHRTPISLTGEPFALHTDEYFLSTPASFVLLLCCTPDENGGGRSLISPVKKIVEILPTSAAEVLRRPLFPSPQGPKAILTRDSRGWAASYNRHQIGQQAERLKSDALLRYADILDELDAAATAVSASLLLDPNDCLILDNRRVLHGREPISYPSLRCIKRVRTT